MKEIEFKLGDVMQGSYIRIDDHRKVIEVNLDGKTRSIGVNFIEYWIFKRILKKLNF
jgi:hypothetical protein